MKMGKAPEGLCQDRDLFRPAAVLAALPRHVDLEKDVHLSPLGLCATRQGLDEGKAVNRVDELEEPNDAADLVSLEMADQMPPGPKTLPVQLGGLLHRLLDPVFSEPLDARLEGLPDEGNRDRLRDTDQSDLIRPSASPAGGVGDPGPDLHQIISDLPHFLRPAEPYAIVYLIIARWGPCKRYFIECRELFSHEACLPIQGIGIVFLLCFSYN